MVGTKAIAIGKARPFENRTIWNQTFKKSGFQMFPDFKWSDFRSPLYIVGCRDEVQLEGPPRVWACKFYYIHWKFPISWNEEHLALNREVTNSLEINFSLLNNTRVNLIIASRQTFLYRHNSYWHENALKNCLDI